MTEDERSRLIEIFFNFHDVIFSSDEKKFDLESYKKSVRQTDTVVSEGISAFNPPYRNRKEPLYIATVSALKEDSNVKIIKPICGKGTNTYSDEENMYYYNQGTIIKRNDGRYEARLFINGKQQYIASSKIKHKAVEKLNQAIELAEKRKQILPSKSISISPLTLTSENITLHYWIDYWIDNFKAKRVKDTYRIKNVVKNHIKGKLPNINLSTLTALQIQYWANSIIQGRTREDAFKLIKEALAKATQLKLVKENVCDYVDCERHERQTGEPLTNEQERIFLDVATKHSSYPYIYYFYLLSGCRVGEVFRIKWVHVDHKNRLLFIDGTKTKTSKRYIPLFNSLKVLLSKIKPDGEYLFNISQDVLKNDFEDNIRPNLGFNFQLKNTRHTFSTRHSEAGVPENVIRVWMGHASLKMTQTVYTKVLPEFSAEQSNKRPDIDIP